LLDPVEFGHNYMYVYVVIITELVVLRSSAAQSHCQVATQISDE